MQEVRTSVCGNSKETGCMNMSYDEEETFDSQVNS